MGSPASTLNRAAASVHADGTIQDVHVGESFGTVSAGGDIRVRSNANPTSGPTGTTFTVTLPRKEG